MEIPTLSSVATTVGVLIATVVVGWAWSLLEWVWFRPTRLERRLQQPGLHVPPYRFFHGDWKDVRRMEAEANAKPMAGLSHDYFPRARPFLLRNITEFGKVWVTWEGPEPVVQVTDVEMAKDILQRYKEFEKPKSNPLAEVLARGLPSFEGHKWATHKKLLLPAFHFQKLKLMLPAFYMSCDETLSLWEKKVSNNEKEINVRPDFITLSANSISRAAFGRSYEEGRRLYQLICDQIYLTASFLQSVYFPGRRYLPLKDNKKLKAIEGEIRTLLRGIIEKRRKEKEPRDDLLGILMDSTSENDHLSNTNKTTRITTEELIDECKVFYLAGQETTSTLLTWTMILLANHPDWQARARDEVLQVFGSKQPDFNGLSDLKVINMILHEVLRLYPPLLELNRRVANDNTRLGGLTLSKGVLISMPLIYIHQDCQIWGDDAKQFNPERFAQGISAASKGSMSFFGFGWGPRICIGSNFAMIEAKIVLSMILQRFECQPSPSYVHAPKAYGFLLHPESDTPIIFNRL